MTTASPRLENWLLAAQALGGAGAGVAWAVSGSSTGWPRIGLAFLTAGGLLAVAAFVALRNSFQVRPSPRHDARLVQTGIYRWLRHPMYVAVMLVLAAAACSRPSTWVLIVVGLNAGLYLGKARYEESVLLHHYDGYAQYREGTLGVRPLRTPDARNPGAESPGSDKPASGPSGRE